MKYGELKLGQIEALVNRLGGMEKVERLLRGELRGTENNPILPLADTSSVQAFAYKIRAGKFIYVDSNITPENFPIEARDRQGVEVKLIHIGNDIKPDDAKVWIDELGCRPAKIWEAVSFCAAHPATREWAFHPVMALGSIWQDPYGRRYFPFVAELTSGRELRLSSCSGELNKYCYFAVVNKFSA